MVRVSGIVSGRVVVSIDVGVWLVVTIDGYGCSDVCDGDDVIVVVNVLICIGVVVSGVGC